MTPPDRATLIAWAKDEASRRRREIQARQAHADAPNQAVIAALTVEADHLDAIAALLEAEAWQPIETAPKMRKVLAFYVNELGKRRTVLACYYTKHALEMDDDYADVGEYDEVSGISYAPEGWYEEHENDSPIMPMAQVPTHWRPLPAPPVTEAR